MTISPFEGLEPALLFSHFEAFTRIPRCSRNEAGAAAHVKSWAEAKGFGLKEDALGNLVVLVPGSPGKEAAPAVVLQGHLDMVGEKDSDSPHNFDTDPIPVKREGDWLRAQGTTLGADNGVGLAASMAVAEDPDAVHGPLELLFTIDEETGLTGAQGLEPGFVSGKTMLNLDSEEEGAVYVGCAGGTDTDITLPLEREAAVAGEAFTVTVAGFRGGHSGLDINTGRGNAVRTLGWFLARLRAEASYALVTLTGGDKHNAIPREATATIVMDAADKGAAEALAATFLDDLKLMYGATDSGFTLTLAPTSAAGEAITDASRDTLLDLILALPHGVLAMSQAVDGLVETSTNLAVVKVGTDSAKLQESTRSSVMPALAQAQQGIAALAWLAGATAHSDGGYPGWQPDMDSPVLSMTKGVHARLFGAEPEVKAIHAGLECGIIGEKMGGMDMISFGPQIENPHSPSEQVKISTLGPFYDLLKGLLAELAG